ncbi:MAG: formylmethanofuran dehydrogenase subunit E family protein, partial [Planctomycetota bacterium]
GSLVLAKPAAQKRRHRVAFEQFPQSADQFQADIRPYVERIIRTHGQEEWESVILTSELHTHLGIYSIIGAKMGLRAREHFGVGLDELSVISFAGRTPPISCLNDGLQASTGATLGHGTISLAAQTPALPKAVFTLGDKSLCLQLKPKCRDAAKSDIKPLVDMYGLEDERYWAAVRRLGLRYWLAWSRRDIFDVSLVEPSP